MKEYLVRLKNLNTGKVFGFRKLLTPKQVAECVVGRVDKNNVQLVEFFEIH